MNLTWRDMQHLVVRTSRPAHLSTDDWKTNGVGRRGREGAPAIGLIRPSILFAVLSGFFIVFHFLHSFSISLSLSHYLSLSFSLPPSFSLCLILCLLLPDSLFHSEPFIWLWSAGCRCHGGTGTELDQLRTAVPVCSHHAHRTQVRESV